jgi:hypothetical protein
MNRAIIPDRKTTNGLSLFNIEDNSSNVTTDSNNSSSNVTTDSNSSSDIDLNLNNYINGLVVYGNLIVYGTLYTYRKIDNIPDELKNTKNNNIQYNGDVIFENDLHIHPDNVLTVSGDIISNNFRCS